jgi:hypothetical protein
MSRFRTAAGKQGESFARLLSKLPQKSRGINLRLSHARSEGNRRSHYRAHCKFTACAANLAMLSEHHKHLSISQVSCWSHVCSSMEPFWDFTF